MPRRTEPVTSIVEGDGDSEGYREWSEGEDEEAGGRQPEGAGAGNTLADWTARFPQLHAGKWGLRRARHLPRRPVPLCSWSWPCRAAAIEAAIERMGGRVAPRLDWSSPSDATWICHNQSLLCTNAEQVRGSGGRGWQ